MPGKVVWSVESDRAWHDGLRGWFEANPAAAELHLLHADIGPTGKWGYPKDDDAHWDRFHRYPHGVWDAEGFAAPDTVPIDGRFRAGCFLAVAYRTTRPVTVYFDDYVDRPVYHVVERFGPPREIVGRMARFELEPQVPKGADLTWIMDVTAQRK